MKKSIFIHIALLVFITLSCQAQETPTDQKLPACYQTDEYFPLLEGKRIGLIANQSSLINGKHLLDSLLNAGLKVQAVFTPEHGFRGNADAGEKINSSKDSKTGTEIRSLYGKTRKPSKEMLRDIDVLVFDIQDVGVRFYTYISTMHLAMEAAAENNIPFIVLDRPNPNGQYFDGPVLDTAFRSFVGMHPIPVVHGLTVGELALMINGEGWLKNKSKAELTVIPMSGYKHNMEYPLPVKPSPNLPNHLSIKLYPSLCFFEATDISIGRGTYFPFQVIGYPDQRFGEFSFVPKSIEGMSKNPRHENKICYGTDLRLTEIQDVIFDLSYLTEAFVKLREINTEADFISRERWFNLLAGNDILAEQILNGESIEDIRKSWSADLETYGRLRKNYLLYPEN